jgi:ketosteroid isomerase-like protein
MDPVLRELVDRQQISDLIHGYCRMLDMNHPEEVADLFTEDCVTDYGIGKGGPIRGRAALEKAVGRAMADFSATHHHLSNISLRFEDDGSVRGVSYIYAWHRRSGDEPDQHLWGEYHDRFVRTPDGWRIAERRLLAAGHQNFPFEWTPIDRRPSGVPRKRSAQ